MSEKTDQYRAFLSLALSAQDAGNEDREELYMSKLDKIWLSMTAEEVAKTEIISRELSLLRQGNFNPTSTKSGLNIVSQNVNSGLFKMKYPSGRVSFPLMEPKDLCFA